MQRHPDGFGSPKLSFTRTTSEVTAAVEERELADPFVQRGHGRKQGRGALDVNDAADVAFIIAGRLLDAALPKFRGAPFILSAGTLDETADDVVELLEVLAV